MQTTGRPLVLTAALSATVSTTTARAGGGEGGATTSGAAPVEDGLFDDSDGRWSR